MLRFLAAGLLLAQRTLAQDNKVGGCVNTVTYGTAPEDPYTVSDITTGASCTPFTKFMNVYGLLFTAGTSGQNVPDNGLKWLAKATTELFPSSASDQPTQKQVLQNMYIYRAANPVFVGSFVNRMEPARDVLSMCDTITIGQDEGSRNGQILEVYEHLLHIITDVGFSTMWPSKWGITASSDLHAAMMQAVNAGIYDVSSYAGMDDEGRTRVEMQEFAYWALSTIQGVHSTYFTGAPGSTGGEWTLMTSAEVEAQLPLFWALHTSTSATVLGTISTSTMDALGDLFGGSTPQTATWPIVDAGRGTLPKGAALVEPCAGGGVIGGIDLIPSVFIFVAAALVLAVIIGVVLYLRPCRKKELKRNTSALAVDAIAD